MAIVFRSVNPIASSASATSFNVAIQSGIQADDLLVIAGGNRVLANPPTNVPTGWTVGSVPPTAGNTHNLWTFYRVADGSEGGTSVTLNFATSTDIQGGVLAYSGVSTTTPLDVAPTEILNNTPSANTHTAPSITPVSNNTMLLHFWLDAGPALWTGADGGTQRFNSAATPTPRPHLGVERAGPAAGVASSAIIATLAGGSNQAAGMQTMALRMAPTPPAAPTGLIATIVTTSD